MLELGEQGLSRSTAEQRLGVLPASLSVLPFFLLVGGQAARPRQLQAGEGEVKRTSKRTRSEQKAREAERLGGCRQLLV